MNSLKYILFGIGLAATIDYNGLNHPATKLLAMGCFAFLFVISLFAGRSKERSRIFTPLVLWYLLACIVNIVYLAFLGREIDVYNQEIALPLMVVFTSYSLFDLDKRSFKLFLLPICLFSAYCAIKTITQGIGSFRIVEYGEVELAKNQMGAAYTTIAIICVVMATEIQSVWVRLSFVILSVINCLPAVFFSCRTAMLCYAVMVVVVICLLFKKKALLYVPILLIIVWFISKSSLFDVIGDSFVGYRDVYNMDEMTSGRFSLMFDSINYFIDHPLFGFLGSGDSTSVMPHNAHITILFRLTIWGLIGAFPFLMLYFYFFRIAIKGIMRKEILVSSILLYAYFESLAEYAPPFGPGSCFIPMFFIVGYYLRNDSSLA